MKPLPYYTSQHGTGNYSKFNCGYACAAMACKFAKGYLLDIQRARKESTSWTMLKFVDIQDQLNIYRISHNRIRITTLDSFIKLMSNPKTILMINVNMADIERNAVVNKPYRTFHPWWGHYLMVDSVDPTHMSMCHVADPYHAESPRLYSILHLYQAMRKHSQHLLVIHKCPIT